ncbi:hypothetical protein EX30DRAFT_83093 [Ascodesmis nigricans]|uniref:RanBP2-type domain-containing protein n=1 Tax=Ascodesmis nigricans TaxID=341454 RepID=A0A4S2N2Z7_9PEZI|nr:hypothetical protein EX30DRAFT_83093 [Ascodesmis nigricans]
MSNPPSSCGAGLHPHPSLSRPDRRERYRIECCQCHHRTYRRIKTVNHGVHCANTDCHHDLLNCEGLACKWGLEKMVWVCWACGRRNRPFEVVCFKCGYRRNVECVITWRKA